jgi:hypothetical protein
MPAEKYDYEVLDEAMNNAYYILTSSKTFEEIMDAMGECSLPFDIRKEGPDLSGMIEYFIETEEYEKCAVLQKMMDEDEKE